MSEATALPTKPQPLATYLNVYFYLDNDNDVPYESSFMKWLKYLRHKLIKSLFMSHRNLDSLLTNFINFQIGTTTYFKDQQMVYYYFVRMLKFQ